MSTKTDVADIREKIASHSGVRYMHDAYGHNQGYRYAQQISAVDIFSFHSSLASCELKFH